MLNWTTNQLLCDANRIHPNLDAWKIDRFAQDVLGFDPAGYLTKLTEEFAARGRGDGIKPFIPQWLNGDNELLNYRGKELKRGKMVLQRGDPEKDGLFTYRYTGWQHGIVPATTDVSQSPETLQIANNYDAWTGAQEYPPANHYIVTKYKNGDHNIGFHFDKAKDIKPKSLITIVKLGKEGRPFQIRRRVFKKDGQSAKELQLEQAWTWPFFDEVLAPGTALVMTLEANLRTQHAVPPCEECNSLTGSIVFRTITTKRPVSEVWKEIEKSDKIKRRKKMKKEDNKRNEEQMEKEDNKRNEEQMKKGDNKRKGEQSA